MATKLETLTGYKKGQVVVFVDPCYGLMEGTIIKLYRYGKDKTLTVKIQHPNNDIYNFFVPQLDMWNKDTCVVVDIFGLDYFIGNYTNCQKWIDKKETEEKDSKYDYDIIKKI